MSEFNEIAVLNVDTSTDGDTGAIPAGYLTVGVFNPSLVDAQFDGSTVIAGSSLTCPIVLNKCYGAMDYDATGSRLIIRAYK